MKVPCVLQDFVPFGAAAQKEEEGEGEGEIPYMCGSIGHRPLWGRCPAASLNYNRNLEGMDTADHLTLLRLLNISC